MAMVLSKVIEEAHEDEIVCLAYNQLRKEIYSAADGDKVIKVWDSRSGSLLRTQQGHKGMVTCLIFSNSTRLLFSGSIDSTVGIWTEKGVNLQMTSVGGTIFSLAWDDRRRFLIVGGHSVIHIFKVDLVEARKLSQQQRSVASGLKDGVGESSQILRRVYQPLRGPDLCHSDVVKCIVVTDTGKIVSGGFDKAICIYEFDKLDKPKEAFSIKRKCHTAAIVSMAYDHTNNCMLTGSIDGSMKVWSIEGRPLDNFENINDRPVCVAYVPMTHMYWASGRFGRLLAYDPRAPSNVTEYVRDANALDRYRVTHLFTPLGSDLILGGTHNRQLVIWKHDKAAAYRMFRKHDAWVETLVVVDGSAAKRRAEREASQARRSLTQASAPGSPTAGGKNKTSSASGVQDEDPMGIWGDDDDSSELQIEQAPEIFSASADGKVLRWQLDADENCDIYECVEEIQLHHKNIYCIAYAPELDCIITGGEDATIRLYYLSGETRTFNDTPLPTSFQEHEGRVTGLAVLKNNLLASVGFDSTIRIWDLTTMKAVSCVEQAHDTPIQCLDYNPDADELATCGMGRKVRIWDCSKPTHIRQKLILNHADHDHDESDGEDNSHNSRNRRSNMTWLTRSDLAGLPKASNPLVDEAIRKASQDTPEVTQVRWCAWRRVWATAADDEVIRIWNTEGHKLHAFTYSGGSCQSLYADNVNKLLVVTMLDKTCCVYSLDDPVPLSTFVGHTDVIRAVSYLPVINCYVTASWDKSLRLWFLPTASGSGRDEDASRSAGGKEQPGLADDEEDEEHYVSEYEKRNPLEVPRALTEANQWQLLKAIGVVDDDKGGKKNKPRAFKVEEFEEPTQDLPGTLGGKLNDLGRELLNEINSIARQRKTAMDILEGVSHTSSDRHAGKGSRPGQLKLR